jgi:hypothetical protein
MWLAWLEQVATVRVVQVVLTIVMGIIFLVGCGGQAGEAPSDPGDRDRTAMDKEPSIPRPSDSILAYSGRTVSGEVGSYSWSSAGSPATCADTAGIPLAPEQQTLTVPVGSVLMFDYGGEGRPAPVQARAYPLEQEKKLLPAPDGTRLMRPKGGCSVLAAEDLKVRRDEGDGTAISAELSSEEYVVEVQVRVPEGDASYYFRAAVEGKRGSCRSLCLLPDTYLRSLRPSFRRSRRGTLGG